MDSPVLDRLSHLQDCHPWLLEDEARMLLVSLYAAMTRLDMAEPVKDRVDLQVRMDEATEALGEMDRSTVEGFLSHIGALKYEAD